MCKEIIKLKKLTKKIDEIYSRFKCSYFVSVSDIKELKAIKTELMKYNSDDYPEIAELISNVNNYILVMDKELTKINKTVLSDSEVGY